MIPQSQLASRIDALGITPTALAAKAGMHHTTLLRILHGGNCEVRSLEAVSRAVVEEERRLQSHLNAIHPAVQEGGA